MQLFGFQFKKKPRENVKSFVGPTDDAEVSTIVASGSRIGHYLDIDGTIVKNENDIIARYRQAAEQPEVDSAITKITFEAISSSEVSSPVSIRINDEQIDKKVKGEILAEFGKVLSLLDFNASGIDIFRRWYIDGKLYYHVIINPNDPKKGIQELRFIDPTRIQKVREVTIDLDRNTGAEIQTPVAEYFIYSNGMLPTSFSTITAGSTVSGMKIATDSIIFVPSGQKDTTLSRYISHIHKAIKPINQLRMLEDAMVIYRYSRAPERRIFYIDTGNMPKGKAEEYVRSVMANYRNKLVYDANSGEIKDDRKHMCLSMNTLIPLLDGRTLSLEEISEEHNAGKMLWVYSCDPITGKFQPGRVDWAGVVKENADVMKITLDNGKTVTCTPEHRFPVWNRGLVRADELSVGDSMIPRYSKTAKLGTKTNRYEQIFLNDEQKWEYTHRAVSGWKDENGITEEFVFNEDYSDSPRKTVHHKNINPFDNSPENLVKMNSRDHFLMHGVIGTNGGKIGGPRAYELKVGVHGFSKERRMEVVTAAGLIGGKAARDSGASHKNYEIGRQNLAEKMQDPEWNSWFRSQQRMGWTEDKKAVAADHAKSKQLSKKGNDSKLPKYTQRAIDWVFENVKHGNAASLLVALNANEELRNEFSVMNSGMQLHNRTDYTKFNGGDLVRLIKLNGFSNFREIRAASTHKNHKIVKIEYLQEKIDVGCITVDGNEQFHSYHTFALDAGIYTENSMLEDFWLPRRGDGKGTEITTLPGGDGMDQTDHLNFFKRKVFGALNVPVSRLDPTTGFSFGRASEISREEVEFQRFIDGVRKKFSQLFLDILKTQLVLRRIIGESDWDYLKEKISIDFLKDNYFTELKEIELLKERISTVEIVEPFVGAGKYFSKEYVRKFILRQTDADIKRIDAEIAEEENRGKKKSESREELENDHIPDSLQDIGDADIADLGDEISGEGEFEEVPGDGESPEPGSVEPGDSEPGGAVPSAVEPTPIDEPLIDQR